METKNNDVILQREENKKQLKYSIKAVLTFVFVGFLFWIYFSWVENFYLYLYTKSSIVAPVLRLFLFIVFPVFMNFPVKYYAKNYFTLIKDHKKRILFCEAIIILVGTLLLLFFGFNFNFK